MYFEKKFVSIKWEFEIYKREFVTIKGRVVRLSKRDLVDSKSKFETIKYEFEDLKRELLELKAS